VSTILPISGTMPVVRKLPGEDAEEAEPIAGPNILSVDRKSTADDALIGFIMAVSYVLTSSRYMQGIAQ